MEISQVSQYRTVSLNSTANNNKNIHFGNNPNIAATAMPQEQTQKPSTSLFQHINNFFAAIEKTWIYAAEYTKGTILGTISGLFFGLSTYGGIYLTKAIKAKTLNTGKSKTDAIKEGLEAGAKTTEKVAKTAKKVTAPKKIKPGKLGIGVSVAVGLLALGHSLFEATLNVNKRSSEVDHTRNTGHMTH